MTPEQEKHLDDIKYYFVKDVDAKYRHGQREHGGNIWLKAGMIDNAIEEVIDLAVYLYTLRDQMRGKYGQIDYNKRSGETTVRPPEHPPELGNKENVNTSPDR